MKSWIYVLLGFIFFFSNRNIVAQERNRPNIILVMTDDQGWGDAGYQGHPELRTPNLDKMASNGLVFNRFYAAAPVCSPTRGSVLTGRHPYRYGINYANMGHIKEKEVVLPEILKEYGYTTGHFGKWHLGTMDKVVINSNRGGYAENIRHYAPPWENGYDFCFATESKVPTWDPMINPESDLNDANNQKAGDSYGSYYWTGPGKIATENLEGDDSRVIMDRVIPFINNAVNQEKPFFSTIWFHTPHAPIVAGKDFLKIYEGLSEDKQHYYGALTAMDEQIGRLRQHLKSLGISENTMIWFVSDNGPAAEGGGPGWEPGGRLQGVTGGFKGRKGTLFEGGLRVPGILEWPAKIKQHRKTDFPAVTSDYFPTILDLLNIAVEDKPVLDGISLKPVIEGSKNIKRERPIGFQSRFEGQEWQVWNDNQYKLVYKEKDEEFLLFDLYKDPYETTDIAENHPKIVNKMKEKLASWIEDCAKSAAGADYK